MVRRISIPPDCRWSSGNYCCRYNTMTLKRPSWDEWSLNLAKAVSKRADCSRRQVGAVVLGRDHRVVSTGFNGSYPGGPSCLAGDCPRARSSVDPGSSYDTGPGACIAIHAECNSVLFADRARLEGATIYITDAPCEGCQKLLRSTPITRVVWPEGEYSNG